jgi:hypothetical protein
MRKQKLSYRIFLIMAIFFLLPAPVEASRGSYSYTYDYWGEERESPDAYRENYTINGHQLGIGSFKEAEAMFMTNNSLYVVDTGNHRIVVIKLTDKGYELESVIDTFKTSMGEDTFSSQEIFL